MTSSFALRSIAVAVCIVAGAGSAGAETLIRFNQALPPGHWAMQRIILPWAKQVEEASKGKVKVQMTGASMGGWAQGIDLVGDGVVDANFGTYGVIGGRFTLAKMTEIPLLGSSDPLAVSHGFWRSYQKNFAKFEEHEKAGVVPLAMWTSGANHFFSREKPIRSGADLRGMKFMVPNEIADRMMRQFGATGINTPQEQIYDIVSKGIVDGSIIANTGPSATKTEQFYKHQTVVPGSLYFTSFYMVMNKKKHDAMPPDERAALDSVSGEALMKLAATVFSELDKAEFDQRKAAGKAQIITADESFLKEIREKTLFVENEWLDSVKKLGIDGAPALKDMRDEATRFAKGS